MEENQKLPDIIIRSEAEAYDILTKALEGDIPEYGQILFEGWPTLELYLKGEKFDQSLTPTVMKGLIELQKGIYRAYSVASFGSPKKRLTDDEKRDLEIKVDVKGGSSLLEINFGEVAQNLIQAIGGRMNSKDLLIAIVSIAVLYFGDSSYKNYLENRKEIAIKESSDETQRKTLETLKFSSEQETKRAEIMANIAANYPKISGIASEARTAQAEVVKSLSAGDQSRVGDVALTPEITSSLTKNARRTSSEVRIDGQYKILKLDWSDPLKFKVRIYSPKTGIQLDAIVQDDSLDGKHKEAIKAGEWSRKLVDLSVNAKLIGDGDYREAVILSASLIPDKDPNEESLAKR